MEEKEKLFEQFRHSLGAPLVSVEITDDMLCSILGLVIEDYAEMAQSFIIESQWESLYGKDLNHIDLAFALSVRSQDFVSQYTYAYSKQVGHQTNGPWELKKDYITLESGRQVYEIPAHREINEVLWLTPPPMNRALMAHFGGFDYGFAGGFGQMGVGQAGIAGATGNSGHYLFPAHDILLTASDMGLKHRMIRSELVYKITAGPNGTRLLHLLSTPGSKLSFGHGIGMGGSLNIAGCQVWYHYYDTSNGNVEECLMENPDIILSPDMVPLSKMRYEKFNHPTKTIIRQLFFAEAKRTLGRVRGKFGGVVGPPEAERTMDWDSLLAEGNEEKQAITQLIRERFMRLSPHAMLERMADQAEFLNRALKFRPLGLFVK